MKKGSKGWRVCPPTYTHSETHVPSPCNRLWIVQDKCRVTGKAWVIFATLPVLIGPQLHNYISSRLLVHIHGVYTIAPPHAHQQVLYIPYSVHSANHTNEIMPNKLPTNYVAFLRSPRGFAKFFRPTLDDYLSLVEQGRASFQFQRAILSVGTFRQQQLAYT